MTSVTSADPSSATTAEVQYRVISSCFPADEGGAEGDGPDRELPPVIRPMSTLRRLLVCTSADGIAARARR